MSFKLFIYYCAMGGGWAAFLAWGIVAATGIPDITPLWRATLIGGILGLFVAAIIGMLDAIMNAVGFQRIARVLLCGTIGGLGGMLGAMIGQALYAATSDNMAMLLIGWILVGVLVGASIGVFDVMKAMSGGGASRGAMRKMLNGVYGGILGGFVGGAPFGFLMSLDAIPRSKLTIGLVILGMCIGLFIGLAQVVLKDAWIRVEAGFRPGREILLTKDKTLIGKAEFCDIGLFGGQGLEKQHARITQREGQFVVSDLNTPGGTFVNDQRVDKPTPLRNGDAIRVGNCILRFGERAKRR
jgi:hypothetical protein